MHAARAKGEQLPPGLPDAVEFNPGGLAVLYAEENSREALFAEFVLVKGLHPLLDRHVARLSAELDDTQNIECRARTLVEGMAVGLQAAQLLRGDGRIGAIFCDSRLREYALRNFGTLAASVPQGELIARALAVN